MKKSLVFGWAVLPLALIAAPADGFLPSGKMTLGANYWASHAATEMWRKWDAKAVEEDLKTLARNQAGDGVFFRNRYGEGTVYVFAHNFEKTYFAATGKYEGDAYRIWKKVCSPRRLL